MDAAKKSKYACDICKQTFDRAERLHKHIQKVHTNNNTTCATCKKKFRDTRMLKRHQKNAISPTVCDHCDMVFCDTNEYEKHRRSIPLPLQHDPEYSLDTPVCPKTGYEDTDGYKEQLDTHWNVIRDMIQQRDGLYMKMNKELTPEFTYKDLQKILFDIYESAKSAYKTNMGFGFMLYHTTDDTFKYFYVSSNSLLFERAFEISNKRDVSKLFQQIVNIDLINNYYLKKSSSSWVLAGLPNLEISAYFMKGSIPE